MTAFRQKAGYLDSEIGVTIRLALIEMVNNQIYNTQPCYSSDSTAYPDNMMPFVDKHMHYLNMHPRLDPDMYIANLRLMTRARV